MSSSDAEESDLTSTRARFVLAAWLCGLSSILYLDRICMAQAVKPIQDDLDLSNTEISLVSMAFTLAYGIFAVPTGRWGDKAGPRSVLMRIVLGWSLFTALTGAATGVVTLILVRFLFGAAEAGAFPNAAKVMARWYPLAERGRVQGVMLAFAQVGAVVAPTGAAYLIEGAGWRWAFLIFGLLGVAWAIGFWLWFRDDPADHRGVNAAELSVIRASAETSAADPGPVPWRAVAGNRGIIVLSVVMILGAFFTYFFYTWFPKYLISGRGVENVRAGWLTSLAMAGSGVGMLLGGWLADRIPRRFDDPVLGRRLVSAAGFLVAAACMFAGTRCDDPTTLAVFWTAAMCAMHVQLPNWWSMAIPQGGRHTATIFGLMNGLGVIGAMASQCFVGVYTDWQSSRGYEGRAAWDPLFDVYVGVLVGGAVAWWFYRFTPLPEPPEAPIPEEATW